MVFSVIDIYLSEVASGLPVIRTRAESHNSVVQYARDPCRAANEIQIWTNHRLVELLRPRPSRKMQPFRFVALDGRDHKRLSSVLQQMIAADGV